MIGFVRLVLVCGGFAMALPGLAAARDQTRADESLQQSGCQMTAYGEKAFGGASWATDAGWTYIGDDWAGKIGSLKIKTGVWRFFENADYQGDHVDLAPGEYKTLRDKWQGKIGSVLCIQQT
jgi:hypothetical protein